jgi:hypothetical protein
MQETGKCRAGHEPFKLFLHRTGNLKQQVGTAENFVASIANGRPNALVFLVTEAGSVASLVLNIHFVPILAQNFDSGWGKPNAEFKRTTFFWYSNIHSASTKLRHVKHFAN